MSSKISSLFLSSPAFEQLIPLHSPQAIEHSRPCFLQLHLLLLQFVLHEHLITVRRLSGAGSNWSAFPSHSCTCRNTCLLWFLAAAVVGGKVLTSTMKLLEDSFSQNRLKRSVFRSSLFFCHCMMRQVVFFQ